MDILDQLPSSPDESERLLDALGQAYANDPRVFIRNFTKLPATWQIEIKERAKTDRGASH